jgi:intracellular septation protein A
MTRRQLLFEILANAVLPYIVYAQAKSRLGASETEALLAATVIPALVVVVGLLRQRKIDTLAVITLVTLGLSIALAAATDDARLLQLRESYLSAAIGAIMLGSAAVGRPVMTWLAPRMVPPERRAQMEHPLVRRLMARLTWIWGTLFASELALKWWMVETLTIGQVLALGPVVFAVLTAFGCLLTLWAAKSLRPRRQGEAL